MPYISQQEKRTVFWEEATSENEITKSCIVEKPIPIDKGGI